MTDNEETTLKATLMQQMSAAYDDPKVMADPELKAILVTAATGLNSDDQTYTAVVSELSHSISEYYVGHGHHKVPESFSAIYHQIQADVEAGKLDDSVLRQQEWSGLVFGPIMS